MKGVGFPGTTNNTGEVSSPLPLGSGTDTGEMRLQSDFALARDERTACFWQSFVNEQAFMAASFKAAMAKLAILGHNANDLIDCSEVVPKPKPAVGTPASFPATTSAKDLQLTCNILPFPRLAVQGKQLGHSFRTWKILIASMHSWHRAGHHPPLLHRRHVLPRRRLRRPGRGQLLKGFIDGTASMVLHTARNLSYQFM